MRLAAILLAWVMMSAESQQSISQDRISVFILGVEDAKCERGRRRAAGFYEDC